MPGSEPGRIRLAACGLYVLYTQDGRNFTSAREGAGLGLCLHLIRLDHGSRTTNALARRLAIPPHRDGGQAQFIDQPTPHSQPASLGAAIDWARGHRDQPRTIDDLASLAVMSQRSPLSPLPCPHRHRPEPAHQLHPPQPDQPQPTPTHLPHPDPNLTSAPALVTGECSEVSNPHLPGLDVTRDDGLEFSDSQGPEVVAGSHPGAWIPASTVARFTGVPAGNQ
jgi:hypothetical protein